MTSFKLFDDKWLKKPSKKELYDLVEEQRKEIERLNTIIEIKTNRIQDLMSRLSKRQDRIDKAIEHIENCSGIYKNALDEKKKMVSSQNVLDILKGSESNEC